MLAAYFLFQSCKTYAIEYIYKANKEPTEQILKPDRAELLIIYVPSELKFSYISFYRSLKLHNTRFLGMLASRIYRNQLILYNASYILEGGCGFSFNRV